MEGTILKLEAVKKYFPIKRGMLRKTCGYVKAVDGVDLMVKAGENLGLVGESGSGKSTLGKIILGLLRPDAGRVIFAGQDLAQLSVNQMQEVRKQIQIVFQDPFASLDPRLTIEGIISEGLIYWPQKNRRAKIEKIQELLNLVGLSAGIINRFPHEFSGGERQRIAIARSLAVNPKFLVLDEAVSSLDVLVQGQVLRLLLDLQQKLGLTYLFITHNLRLVRKVCSYIAVMHQGRIVEEGPGKEIFNNAAHPYTKKLLSAAIDFSI